MFTVRKNGFYVQGRNPDGSCSTSSGNLFTNFDFPLRFGTNAIYSCGMTYTGDQLQTFCNNAEYKNFILYKMVNDIHYVGIFGNSNYTYLKEWVPVFNDITLDNKTFISNETSCYFPASLKLDILYSRAGSVDNAQNYVVAARLSSTNLKYSFTGRLKDTVDVNMYFVVNYVQLDESYFKQTKFSFSYQDFLPKNIADPYIS